MALFNVAPASIPTGINPRGIATADLNGDGHLDLLIANFGDSNVEIRSGNGHGSFVLGTLRSVYGVNGPDIAIGDLDRDGDLDFVVNNESHDSVLALYNNGSGTWFTPALPFAVEYFPRAVRLGDLDGDGDLDLVSSNYGMDNLSILLAAGLGVVRSAGSPVGTRPTGFVLADFDGDRDLDIAVANNEDNNVSILLNNGLGTFTGAGGSPVAVGARPTDVAAGDLDGDGDNDLVVANYGANTLTILRNNGSGAFTAVPPGVFGGTRPATQKHPDPLLAVSDHCPLKATMRF